MNKPPYGFTIEYTVPMRAIGKARPRFTRWGCTYTPEKTKKAEEKVAEFATVVMQGLNRLETEAVAVSLDFAFAPPKSWSKKKRREAIETKAPRVGKPDLDNLEKLVCDAMNKIVYRDDGQITESHKYKFFAETDYIKIRVWEVGDGKR